MKGLKIISISIFILLLFSCGGQEKAFDFPAIANDLCKCMQPLADLNDDILDATQKNDSITTQKLILKIENIASKSEACAQKLDLKYGIIPPEQEPKAEAAFKKACPDIAKIME